MVLHKIYLPVKKKWYPKVPGIHPKWHKYNKPNGWNGLHTKFDQSKEACSHAVMRRAASWRLCSKQKEHGILKTVVLQRGQRDISKQGSLIHPGNSLKSSRWLSHRHFHGVSKNWNERLWTVPATPSPLLSLLAAAHLLNSTETGTSLKMGACPKQKVRPAWREQEPRNLSHRNRKTKCQASREMTRSAGISYSLEQGKEQEHARREGTHCPRTDPRRALCTVHTDNILGCFWSTWWLAWSPHAQPNNQRVHKWSLQDSVLPHGNLV